jgi:tetratricopeptide (TPR) repeat protein
MPVHPQELAYHNSGGELFKSGQFSQAAAAYQRALELQPDRAGTHYNLANALLNSGRADEAIAAYRRAVQLRADFPRAWNNMGNALYRLGHLDEAIDAYRKALELEPDEAAACNNLANALRDSGRTAEALSLYDRAVGLRQNGFERSLTNKAMLLIEMGELDGARHAVREALGINPNLVAAWHLRVMLKTLTPTDPDLESLERLLERADTLSMTGEDRMRLRFALGKAWLDAGEADRAFTHLEQANCLKRATFEYDSAAALARIDALRETFTPELLQRFSGTGAGHPTEVPVFVIGMPRSGTTLIEQILASHPLMQGAGELTLLRTLVPEVSPAQPYPCPPVYPPLLAEMTPAQLTCLGRKYESRLCELHPGKARVIDKMPANFLYAGFIHLILPDARIIHCRRDPLDTCLSCYTRVFNGDMVFAYDQAELGSYYRHYEALADHWRRVLPSERYTEVRYENVVENFESESRRLVEFCGVPWSEDCLGFHQSDRQIRTASAIAVRKPVYRSSVGRARAHARHLRPLIDALAG